MKLTGQGLVAHAISKKGTPYFYGAKMNVLTESFMAQMHKAYPGTVTNTYMAIARAKKMVGHVCVDCSGLISDYTKKQLGSSQLYSQAYARLPISTWRDWAIGVITWKKGHVGIYIGEGKVVEAKGINYGVVVTDIEKGRWTCGLTFSWIDYTIENKIDSNVITYKAANPYTEPKRVLKKGMTGQDVKWLQYELVEAGYKLSIDGDLGKKSDKALRDFQKSAKLVVDGKCGEKTIAALKGN